MHVDTPAKPSASIDIEVVPASPETQKALVFLSDPNNVIFLIYGDSDSEDRPHRLTRFEEMVAQCGDTLLGRMMAARVGIEYYEQFDSAGTAMELRTQRKKTGYRHPFLVKAQTYLRKGVQLPDEFLIREESLLGLAFVEWVDGNDERTDVLLNELVEKYPNTRCGKKAAGAMTEVAEMRRKEKLLN